jgi:hypothetical protein
VDRIGAEAPLIAMDISLGVYIAIPAAIGLFFFRKQVVHILSCLNEMSTQYNSAYIDSDDEGDEDNGKKGR